MNEFFETTLFQQGNIKITIFTLVQIAILFFVIFVILVGIRKALFRSPKLDIGRKYALFNLVKYIFIVLTFLFTLQILGFNLSVILAGSAALLVGLGIGLQNLFNDFISGIIILIDGTVEVNDIIQVNDIVCKVKEIKLRTTKVITRDERYIILPNSYLTSNLVQNWTHNNESARFEVRVSVEYSSDPQLVTNLLIEAAKNVNKIDQNKTPFVRFNEFADSALIFTVYFWSDEIFRIENIQSELRYKIFELFKQNGVGIPFPQRVVHFATTLKTENQS